MKKFGLAAVLAAVLLLGVHVVMAGSSIEVISSLSGEFELTIVSVAGLARNCSRLWPSVLTVAGMAASFLFLSLALKNLPLGTAYAVWTGIGTVGTLIFGILLFHENVSAPQILCVCLIVSGIVGLRLLAGQ